MKANWQRLSERVEYEEQFNALDEKLFAGFTTRNGGVSEFPYKTLNMGFHVGDTVDAVVQNRERVAKDVGFSLDHWVGSEQVHASVIQEVTKSDRGRGARSLRTAINETDGLYTRETDILLTSLYADCVPLYFYSPKNQIIGLCHAGWKGTVDQIGPKMVSEWVEKHGVQVSDIHILIGPCISQQQYEVDRTVIDRVNEQLPMKHKGIYTPTRADHFQLHLPALNRYLLEQAGILSAHIIESDRCTFSDDAFFSHRQDQGKTGRMMSMIGMKKVVER
ncbi:MULTISPECIES: peptidoglycan editing factor PgeF [Shouchella]|uniref:Purine nucleoside phosphorylase n=2 Tax=Shouchella TaxID=2893057 RepID=A0ABY7W5F1_9BACI|nr:MULTISPECIES: peptidoglycan editing factor PgeF [Shouchella]MED4127376.1 peptidoglycan editing factor PgeF [Shouchella miscanthi]WDF03846.1 peptidoglycan editing factor PgeF [Shouchella hunanensis]GAF22203.1 LOW QUALITY PROTEIN: hypothetical protein JCM19047_1942 [Bacillus sp. JCM 19047]